MLPTMTRKPAVLKLVKRNLFCRALGKASNISVRRRRRSRDGGTATKCSALPCIPHSYTNDLRST